MSFKKRKKSPEERSIKGEVEGYSRQITPFPGGRGSKGIKIEGDWHNIIGSKDFLELLNDSFPPGSYVVFAEKKNKKDFWDVIEGTLKKITKKEAYSEEMQDNIVLNEPVPVENITDDTQKFQNKVIENLEKIESNQPHALLIIKFINKQGPKITLKIPKVPTEVYQNLLLILLAQTNIAQKMLMDKISKRIIQVEDNR